MQHQLNNCVEQLCITRWLSRLQRLETGSELFVHDTMHVSKALSERSMGMRPPLGRQRGFWSGAAAGAASAVVAGLLLVQISMYPPRRGAEHGGGSAADGHAGEGAALSDRLS